MIVSDSTEALRSYYAVGEERGRLGSACGALEFERTKELIERYLSPVPIRAAKASAGSPGADVAPDKHDWSEGIHRHYFKEGQTAPGPRDSAVSRLNHPIR